MKRKFSRLLGVGLSLMLLTSLLMVAAPVSAGPLAWVDEDLPDELEAGMNVLDLAVAEGGAIIYAAPGSTNATQLHVSSDVGEGWSATTVVADLNTIDADFVAVALDDPEYIAVAGNTTTDAYVYISDDGGATFDTLLEVDDSLTIKDISIAVETDGDRWVAVVGDGASGAEVWAYEIGAIGAAWDEISLDDGFAAGQHWAEAVEFSPNFNSDEVLVCVTANHTDNTNTTDAILFQIYSFNQGKWNADTGTFTDYPVEIVGQTADAQVNALDSASIALSPDYLGSDSSLRIAFVGITTDNESADEADGIFRLDDDDVDTVKDDTNIHSVAYDGTNLVAGDYDDTTVYRCDDPLASSPSVSSSAGTKSPGGVNLTVVAWAGDEVVAATSGDESAFAVSEDDGKCFNDLSLIDTSLDTLCDVAVSADGSMVYMVSANDTDSDADLSLWLYASRWERILSVRDITGGAEAFIVRLAPDDADVVYVADAGGTPDDDSMYYSGDAGQARWHNRTSRYDIVDLAVETDGEVCYVLTTSGYVSESTNTGFTWGGKESTDQSGSHMILSLGEDLVLVGGDSTKYAVAYSTDGNESWEDLDELPNAGNVQVAASGLTTDDFIFASTSALGDDIYRWDWADDEWDEIYESVNASQGITGIGLANGMLYAVSSNLTAGSTLYRTNEPFADDVDDWDVETASCALLDFIRTPSALRTGGGSIKLWTIADDTDELYSYEDTLVVAAPALRTPTHASSVPINPVTGRAWDLSFAWDTPSDDVVDFQIRIALDEGFDQLVLKKTVTEAADEGDVISQVIGPNSADADFQVEFMPETTYYWKVRVTTPVLSPYSIIYTFTVGEAVAPFPEVTVEAPPAPQVTVTAPPAPEVTITVPPAPAPVTPAPAIPAILLWTIIIIGAVLIIALIVLIVRTRRVV